jgi:hypothetical protein
VAKIVIKRFHRMAVTLVEFIRFVIIPQLMSCSQMRELKRDVACIIQILASPASVIELGFWFSPIASTSLAPMNSRAPH